MQHPDEGTIHSWLDGALSGEEAARVEAHVKECPQCAAAVAEARGFIAASSRILTALDNAPRGVIPAAAPARRVDPMVWRIAATVLVVAAGTLAVLRNGVGNTKAERAAVQTAATASSAIAPQTLMRDESAAVTTTAPAAPVRIKAQSGSAMPARAMAKPRNVPAAPPAAQTFAQPMGAVASGAVATDAVSEQPPPLKVVGTPRTIGAKLTLYEVAPGDTVTLTEPMAFQLQSVATGVPEQPVSRQAAGKAAAAAPMRRADAAAISAPEASVVGQASRVESANGVTTISWPDPITGKTLRLSGHMPAARLQEIRLRIERERAAAAAEATKKTP